jgi:hypothetical protein
MKDCCFVIFTELSTVAAYAAIEGNGSRTENVRVTDNTSIDTKSPTITLIFLLFIFWDDGSVVLRNFNIITIARIYFL